MFVYLLQYKNNTYVGATVDVNRRLRQHNCEIKGGAMGTCLLCIWISNVASRFTI